MNENISRRTTKQIQKRKNSGEGGMTIALIGLMSLIFALPTLGIMLTANALKQGNGDNVFFGISLVVIGILIIAAVFV